MQIAPRPKATTTDDDDASPVKLNATISKLEIIIAPTLNLDMRNVKSTTVYVALQPVEIHLHANEMSKGGPRNVKMESCVAREGGLEKKLRLNQGQRRFSRRQNAISEWLQGSSST
eukprot:6188267-Pleurochrysis_carterae.AAC.4